MADCYAQGTLLLGASSGRGRGDSCRPAGGAGRRCRMPARGAALGLQSGGGGSVQRPRGEAGLAVARVRRVARAAAQQRAGGVCARDAGRGRAQGTRGAAHRVVRQGVAVLGPGCEVAGGCAEQRCRTGSGWRRDAQGARLGSASGRAAPGRPTRSGAGTASAAAAIARAHGDRNARVCSGRGGPCSCTGRVVVGAADKDAVEGAHC